MKKNLSQDCKHLKRAFERYLPAVLILSCLAPPSLAGAFRLGWEPNPDPLVVGHRIYLGSSPGQYEQVFEVEGSNEFDLADLEPGQNYYFVVTAYNVFDLESQPSEEIRLGEDFNRGNANDGKLLFLEAEEGRLSGPVVVDGEGVSAWVEAGSALQEGEVSLDFEISVEGEYRFWCRVHAQSNSSDSFFVSIDGGEEQVFHVYGSPNPPSDAFQSGWIWRAVNFGDAVQDREFETGTHTMTFRMREGGAKLDRLLISSEPSFVPTDLVPREGSFFQFIENGGPSSVLEGEPVSLWSRTLSAEEYSFQWYRDGEPVVGKTEPFLYLSSASSNDSGNYILQLTSLDDGKVHELPALLVEVELSALTIGSFRRLSPTEVLFAVQDPDNRSFEVEVSSFLGGGEWSSLGVWDESANGDFIVADPEAADHPRRFYRIKVLE
jgi:hypothetical protein